MDAGSNKHENMDPTLTIIGPVMHFSMFISMTLFIGSSINFSLERERKIPIKHLRIGRVAA